AARVGLWKRRTAEKSKNRLSRSAWKSRKKRGIPTFPQPRLLLEINLNRTFHLLQKPDILICYEQNIDRTLTGTLTLKQCVTKCTRYGTVATEWQRTQERIPLSQTGVPEPRILCAESLVSLAPLLAPWVVSNSRS